MGQFSVQFALCHRVLLISTFFSHSPPPPPEALPGSGAGDITNSKQWLSVGEKLAVCCMLLFSSISVLQVRPRRPGEMGF